MDDTPITERLVKHVAPHDAFRFYAGSENMNLPVMYVFGSLGVKYVTVVARDVDRTFPIGQIDRAFELYKVALEELGYLD